MSRLPQARIRHNLKAQEAGYLAAIHAERVGWATFALGAGRITKTDVIDHAVGIEVHKNVGDKVVSGDLLLTVHANDEGKLEAALAELEGAVEYSGTAVDPLPHFYGRVDSRNG